MTTFAYLSSGTFLKAPAADTSHRYAIAGVTWDGSTTNRPGARLGPRAIRQASHMLCDGTHPHFGLAPGAALGDAGDLPLPNTGLEALRAALRPQARALMARHHVAWLGGDHSITLTLLQAMRELLGRPLGVIHFDAHCDTWADHFGEPSGHGTWVREAFEQGLVVPECFVQIGIRSPGAREDIEYVADHGGLIFNARALRGRESPAQLADVLAAVRQRWAAHGQPPAYLSLDIDCLDPAFAPGTGTPEPAGLTSAQVMTLLEEWGDLPFAGMDCVEVSPPFDHAELTAMAAANFVWTYLCGRIAAGSSTAT
jgi:agmatinase